MCWRMVRGAGMSHPFMAGVSDGLAERGIATLRCLFTYMEQGSKRPDPPKLAQATVRAAVAEASRLVPKLALIAGGKSFGGRMTSQAQAALPLPGVRALVFLGFPLHPVGRPSDERSSHLFEVKIPMPFLQGTRDALADTRTLQVLVERLGSRGNPQAISGGGPFVSCAERTGRTDAEVAVSVLAAKCGLENYRLDPLLFLAIGGSDQSTRSDLKIALTLDASLSRLGRDEGQEGYAGKSGCDFGGGHGRLLF
jgi:hypothetical protein